MERMEAGEIDVAAIHDVDGASLREQPIERLHVVQLAIREVDEARDIAALIQPEILAGIELPGLDDQSLGESAWTRQSRPSLASVRVERRPVCGSPCGRASTVGLTDRSQCRAGSPARSAAPRHRPILFGAGKRPYPTVAAISATTGAFRTSLRSFRISRTRRLVA